VTARVARLLRGGALCATLLLIAAAPVRAQLAVFDGDPADGVTGAPYSMLPGLPLVLPGPDGKYATMDDVVDTGLTGDVDVVIRTGGTFTGGAIPQPHAGVASAPVVVAGGQRIGIGDEATFQVILSDGLPPSVFGNPILTHELDVRGTLVFAYGDLDGDGFVGPRAADGDADLEIERQEVLAPVGRTVGAIASGVATGTIATSVGAPASAGGLGVVLSAGVATGSHPYLFEDGPWISTMAPAMFPLEQAKIVGGEPGQPNPDPLGIVDLELSDSSVFIPRTSDPTLGSRYAIPLDGTSPTVDLLRSESAEATRAVFAVPLDLATFKAGSAHRVLPAVDEHGDRALAEHVTQIALPCDGDASRVSLALMPADPIANPADPPPGGSTVVLQASPLVRIASPDTDGDPSREEISFADAAWVRVELDDAGQPLVEPARQHVLVLQNGVPVEMLRVDLAAAAPRALDATRTKLVLDAQASRDRLMADATFTADPLLDLTALPLALRVSDADGTIFERFLPAGALLANADGRVFRFHDPGGAQAPMLAHLSIRRALDDPTRHTLKLRVKRLEAGARTVRVPALRVEIAAATALFAADAPCSAGVHRAVCATP
jgi:hypothetical protein